MNVTALIADDSISIRTIIQKTLEEIGVKKIIEVRDGVEAVNKTLKLKPDIVFLDLVMPKKDGRFIPFLEISLEIGYLLLSL